MNEIELKGRYPSIPWDEPVQITVPGLGQGLGCRICIALYGVKGENVTQLAQTLEEFEVHRALEHGSLSQRPGQ